MTWTGPADAPPTARIATLAPSMHASVRRVADTIAADIEGTVERTAQELADHADTSRTTVVRTAQALGYDGYPQLRVALAFELASTQAVSAPIDNSTLLGAVLANVDRFGSRLRNTTAALTEDGVAEFIHQLDVADSVLVAAHGLSLPLSLDLALRLNAVGRPAEYLPDALAQQIRARQLSTTSVCLAVSGSGASTSTLAVIRAARAAGAKVLSLTSFAGSPVDEASDVCLVVPPVEGSFQGELVHTSRTSLALISESLVDALIVHRGDRGSDIRATALEAIGNSITE